MSEPTDYSIKNLYKLFQDHAEKADKQRIEWVKEFETNYPGEPLPEWLLGDFNLPRALAAICGELL